MLSSNRRACSASSTVILPVFTTCFGPRTACAALLATIWPPVEQHADGGKVLLHRRFDHSPSFPAGLFRLSLARRT